MNDGLPLTPDKVFSGDYVLLVVDTHATEWCPMPATHHHDHYAWHVRGKTYGAEQIRIGDHNHEYTLEWDDRTKHWRVKSMLNAHIYPAVQSDTSPADWPCELTLSELGDVDVPQTHRRDTDLPDHLVEYGDEPWLDAYD